MTKEERLQLLEEAQKMIHDAVNNIYQAFEEMDEIERLETYICGHLSSWADGDNLNDYTSIPRLIEQIEEE